LTKINEAQIKLEKLTKKRKRDGLKKKSTIPKNQNKKNEQNQKKKKRLS